MGEYTSASTVEWGEKGKEWDEGAKSKFGGQVLIQSGKSMTDNKEDYMTGLQRREQTGLKWTCEQRAPIFYARVGLRPFMIHCGLLTLSNDRPAD